jgi:hypothetical protein
MMQADPRRLGPWVDLEANIDWLAGRPHLIAEYLLQATVDRLEALGFQVIRLEVHDVDEKFEESLLIELCRRLEFSPAGAGSYASFNDRLWDFLEADRPPVAIVIQHFDRVLNTDVRAFARCIYQLLSMTEDAGVSAPDADLQLEFFFSGRW